jgi:hypothetical protein
MSGLQEPSFRFWVYHNVINTHMAGAILSSFHSAYYLSIGYIKKNIKTSTGFEPAATTHKALERLT